MLQSLRNRRNRKGFTLAELLIVVAIIAVLVAIAVPIFISALDRAENAVIEANERTVKGMAVTMILSDDSLLYKSTDGSMNKSWKVHATCDKEGNITLKKAGGIVVAKEGEKEEDWEGTDEAPRSKKTKNGYDLYVWIDVTELE